MKRLLIVTFFLGICISATIQEPNKNNTNIWGNSNGVHGN